MRTPPSSVARAAPHVIGSDMERATDFDETKARARYKTFRDNYDVIAALQRSFHFSVIDATRSIEQVQADLMREFAYQSSLELSQDTYQVINEIPTLSQITMVRAAVVAAVAAPR